MIHFRFTHKTPEDLERFKKFIISFSTPTMMVLESADGEVNRDHTHTVISVNITLSTFRQQFKAKFANYTLGDFGSSLVRDEVDNERYICKGKTNEWDTGGPIILYSNCKYDEVLQRLRHQEYWAENLLINNRRIKKEKRLVAKTWLENCYDEIVEETKSGLHTWDTGYNSKQIVFKKVMMSLGRCSKKLSPKIVRELCDGILNKLAPRSVQADYWNLVFPEEWSGG